MVDGDVAIEVQSPHLDADLKRPEVPVSLGRVTAVPPLFTEADRLVRIAEWLPVPLPGRSDALNEVDSHH